MSQALMKAIELLIFGWGGVFGVILIIYLASVIISKAFPVKNK